MHTYVLKILILNLSFPSFPPLESSFHSVSSFLFRLALFISWLPSPHKLLPQIELLHKHSRYCLAQKSFNNNTKWVHGGHAACFVQLDGLVDGVKGVLGKL